MTSDTQWRVRYHPFKNRGRTTVVHPREAVATRQAEARFALEGHDSYTLTEDDRQLLEHFVPNLFEETGWMGRVHALLINLDYSPEAVSEMSMMQAIYVLREQRRQPGVQADPESHVQPPGETAGPSVAADFSSVRWHDIEYVFNLKQATCVKALYEEYKNRRGTLHESTIGERVDHSGDHFRLDHVFRENGVMHEAWGTLIRKVRKGVYRFADPRNTE